MAKFHEGAEKCQRKNLVGTQSVRPGVVVTNSPNHGCEWSELVSIKQNSHFLKFCCMFESKLQFFYDLLDNCL